MLPLPRHSSPTYLLTTNMPEPSPTKRLPLEQVRFINQANQATVALCYVLESQFTSILSTITRLQDDDEALAHSHQQVIVALATLQSSVQDLSRAYIQHANTVLAPGKHGLTPIDSNLTSILTESGLLSGRAAEGVAAPVETDADGKKKRKRTPHDPNAPKRALTPYFLYMQSARATIAKELGDSAKPKEVADEGTRRWTEMSPAEKSVCQSISPQGTPTDIVLGLG